MKVRYVPIVRLGLTWTKPVMWNVQVIFSLLLLVTGLQSACCFSPAIRRGPARARSVVASEEEAASDFTGAEAVSALSKDVTTVFTLEDVHKILPHRYPFALVRPTPT